jgi:hypothetical protein
MNFARSVIALAAMAFACGGGILLGAVVAMWPDAREQRRLVLRYAPAHA